MTKNNHRENQTINQVLCYIKSDIYRYYGKYDFKTIIKALIFNRTFRWQFSFRLSKSKNCLIRFIARLLHYFNSYKYRILIPRETNIGYGLYIGHGGPIVINGTTIIGNNVNLSQFTTIGSNEGKSAKIGDNVYIGPNVCIVDDVKIGNNVTIGAGSVVTKDIPDNATAVGNYAKVINYNNPGRYVSKRWNV